MMILRSTFGGGIFHLVCLALQLRIASLNICGDGQVMHSDYKTGERACCYNRLCQPGFYSVICKGNDPNSTSCRRCPKQTFQPEATNSVDMKHCEAKTICYANQVARNAKSKTKDTVCKCKRGYCNSSGSVKFQRGRMPRCIKKNCSEGLCLATNCTCQPCPEGLKENRRHNLKSCNSSSSLNCKEKRASTALGHSTTSPEVTLGNTSYELHSNGDSSLTTEPDKTQSSSNDSLSDLSGSIPAWQMIIIVILSILAMISVVVFLVAMLIRKRTSSESYSKHLPNSDSQLENGEATGFTKPTCTEELIPILQLDKQREKLEISNIEPVAPTRNDGGKDISRDLIATELTLSTLPIKSDTIAQGSDTIVQAVPSLSMKLSDKRKLTDNICVLTRDLVLCPHLWAVLLSNETVTDEMKNKIEEKGITNSGRNALLIEYLQKRNCHAFETFVASLIMTKQEHLAVRLDKELVVKLNDSFPTDELLLKHIIDLSKSISTR